VKDAIPDPVIAYLRILDDLLALRSRGNVDDETEAHLATAMNDWRTSMTAEQQAALEQQIAERLAR